MFGSVYWKANCGARRRDCGGAREMADRLNRAALSSGPFPHADIAIQGTLEAWLDVYPALEVEDRLRGSLAESRSADSENNKAPIGPHRSDLHVVHVEKGQPAIFVRPVSRKPC